jgi:hypothetical protein
LAWQGVRRGGGLGGEEGGERVKRETGSDRGEGDERVCDLCCAEAIHDGNSCG